VGHAVLNVAPVNCDIIVAIGAALFVPETQRVRQFVHDDVVVRPVEDAELLCAAGAANHRPVAARLNNRDIVGLTGARHERQTGDRFPFVHRGAHPVAVGAADAGSERVRDDTAGPLAGVVSCARRNHCVRHGNVAFDQHVVVRKLLVVVAGHPVQRLCVGRCRKGKCLCCGNSGDSGGEQCGDEDDEQRTFHGIIVD
jgi:hypothetical protein